MADQKVSDLPSLSGADVDAADLLYIIDSSAGSAGSKKITVGQYQLAPVSGGTANTVVYLNGSKVESSSSALTFDGTNFATTGTSSAAKLIPTGGTATGNGMYLPAANTLAWSNNGVETMRLDSSGNLGLGVTPSAWGSNRIAVQVVGASLAGVVGSNALAEVSANRFINSSGQDIYVSSTAASVYQQATGAHFWFTAPSGTAGNAISFTQAMTLDASGNLSCIRAVTSGNSTFAGSLNAQGGGSGATIAITPDTISGSNGVVYNTSFVSGGVGPHIFQTGGTERARITSGGDLLVGTTTSLASYRFQVASGSNSGGIFQTTAAGSFGATAWNTATSGDNLFFGMFTEGIATQRGSIDYNRAGGLTRYNTTSDYRAKDILGPVQNPGATIDALKVYEGVMKGATQSRPMLVAHEAQAVAPYAVSGVKDEVNEDGSPKFQQMDVSSLVPLLLAEIQSLRARVAALESA